MQQIKRFWELIVAKTIEEKQNLYDCRKEVDKKNLEMLRTLLFGVTLILGFSFVVSFFSDVYVNAGIASLRWAYLAISALALLTFLYIQFISCKNITFMLYLVMGVAFFYSFVLSAFVSPHQVTVTFLIVLFMVSTLFLDYGWRIHTFMLVCTIGFVYAISFFKTSEAYNAESMNTLTVLAILYIIGTIVRGARLDVFVARNKLHYFAYFDQLTGVHNRRKLFEDFAKFEAGKKDAKVTALALLDIDHFKLFNDAYGHQAGDFCLTQIGASFTALEKTHNMRCYRYGGEEFAIMFLDSSKEQIIANANALNECVKALNITHTSSTHGVVTISIGVAYIPDADAPKFQIALSASDIALYRAKEKGRNNVVFTEYSPNAQVTDFEIAHNHQTA